jgi:hypothetical protein
MTGDYQSTLGTQCFLNAANARSSRIMRENYARAGVIGALFPHIFRQMHRGTGIAKKDLETG